MGRSRAVLVALLAVVAVLGAVPAGAGASQYVPYGGEALAEGLWNETWDPTALAGGNNGCRPSSAHPYPVVLVHGTFADMSDSWQALSPLLADHGYCVFALNYGSSNGSGEAGVYATGPIPASAEELDAFVQKVLAATGASKVDVVGHSQGGMMPRYFLRFLGGAGEVGTLVGEHLSMPYDHIADADVLDALDPKHPVAVSCTPVLPVAGG